MPGVVPHWNTVTIIVVVYNFLQTFSSQLLLELFKTEWTDSTLVDTVR